MNRSALIITVAIIAFACGLGVRGLLADAHQDKQKPMADFSLPDLSGKQHSIKEWQGKVLVLNFWATWCPPCLKEMPEFEALQNEYSGKGLQVIGIALDEAEPVKEFIANQKITYPILLGEDQGTKIAHDLGNIVNTVPFTVVVNKKGMVVKSHMGTLTREELQKITSTLF